MRQGRQRVCFFQRCKDGAVERRIPRTPDQRLINNHTVSGYDDLDDCPSQCSEIAIIIKPPFLVYFPKHRKIIIPYIDSQGFSLGETAEISICQSQAERPLMKAFRGGSGIRQGLPDILLELLVDGSAGVDSADLASCGTGESTGS